VLPSSAEVPKPTLPSPFCSVVVPVQVTVVLVSGLAAEVVGAQSALACSLAASGAISSASAST